MKHARSFVIAGVATLLSVSTLRAATKTNYQDDVLPIFRNNCLNCHNPDKKKAGLDLSTYGNALLGSSNGPVINSGDPDGSLLYKAVTHAEEPTMPPKKEKLPDKELAVIKDWIASGALETATGKPVVSNKPKINMTVAANGMKRPDGPPPMPGDLLPEPVVRSDRPWAAGCIANSPWAPVVAIGGQHQVLIYQTDSLDLLGVVPYTEGEPQVVQFSKNGRVLLIGGGIGAKSGKVSLWDVPTGQKITDIGDEFDVVLAADISADQGFVALGGPTKVFKVYSTHDGALIHAIKKHTDWVTAVAYSPDGSMVASADRAGGMWVWEAKSAGELYNLAGHKAGVTSVAFRDDSNVLASASEDGTVKLWDMQSGKEIKTVQAHGTGVLSVAFTHDGRFVTTGRDKQVKVWAADGSAIKTLDTFNDIALHATFDHDGKRVIAGDWTGELRVLDAADGKLIGKLSSNPAPLSERLTAAEKRIPELQAALEKANADASAARAAAEKAVQDQKAAEGAPAAAKAALEAAQARYKSADDVVQGSKPKINKAQSVISDKQEAIPRADKEREVAAADLEAAKQQLKAQDEVVAARQKKADALSETATSAKAEAEKKSDDEKLALAAREKKDAADKAAKELDDAKSSAKAKAEKVAALTDAMARAESKLAKLNEELASAKKELADQNAAADKARSERKEADAAIPKAKAAVAAADKGIAPAVAQAKAAQTAADAAKAAIEPASQQLANGRLEIARLTVGQYFLGVYAAKQDLAAHETELEKISASVKSAQSEMDDDTVAIAAARKLLDEGPTRLLELKKECLAIQDKINPANAAAESAKADLAQKQGLLSQANELSTKLWAESKKLPNDKQLAEAAEKAKSTVDALTSGVEAATKDFTAKDEAAKAAVTASAAAEASRQKYKASFADAPNKIESLHAAIAAAKSEIPKRKAAAEEAAKVVEKAKAKVTQLTAEYQKKSQEAGLNAQASAQSKG